MSDIDALVETVRTGLSLRWDGAPPEPEAWGELRQQSYAALAELAALARLAQAKESEEESDG